MDLLELGTDRHSWEIGVANSERTSRHKETQVFMDCQIIVMIPEIIF